MTGVVEFPNFRLAEVNFKDTVRRIALRELGSAEYWRDLVVLNSLRPPYVAATASDGVLAYGDKIMIPSAAAIVDAESDPADVYATDLLVKGKRLSIVNGDFDVASGVPNLSQSLARRVLVDKRELPFHPEYGCWVSRLRGWKNGPTAGRLAAFYVKSSLLEDDRVDTVPECLAEIVGDQITVSALVNPISGKPVELKLVV